MLLPTLNAQSPLSAGAKTGLSYSNLIVDDESADYSYAIGYHAGAFARYTFGDICLQTEVVVSNLAAKVESGNEELDISYRYISIPVLMQYNVTPSIQLAAGPQVGILCCMKSTFHPITRQPFVEQDYTKAYKKTDFGFQAGAGWESANGILIDLRYYYGLSDISDFDGVASTKNRWVQLSVGYRLKFK
jgi:hypothetical protein